MKIAIPRNLCGRVLRDCLKTRSWMTARWRSRIGMNLGAATDRERKRVVTQSRTTRPHNSHRHLSCIVTHLKARAELV